MNYVDTFFRLHMSLTIVLSDAFQGYIFVLNLSFKPIKNEILHPLYEDNI